MRVGLVGLGLIGGSIGLRLVRNGAHVEGCDPDPATRAAAAAAGVVVHEDLGDWVAGLDLVVLAGPMATFEETLAALAPYDGPTVIDAGSVKGPVHALAAGAGLVGRFVGCHPMAGTEHTGFGAAAERLLVGVTWAVTVTPETDPERALGVVDFLLREFEARVIVLDPAEHDRAVATISHLPHIVASALLSAVSDDVAAALAAGSFRDGTRVGGRTTARTVAMLTENRVAVEQALARVTEELLELQRVLGDDEQVFAWAERSRAVRHRFFAGESTRRTAPRDLPALLGLGSDGWLVVGSAGEELVVAKGELNRAFAT